MNKMDLPHKSFYSVFFQVLPEILSQMQPELPKECRKPTRHAALSGKTMLDQNCNFSHVCDWRTSCIYIVVNNIASILIIMISLFIILMFNR